MPTHSSVLNELATRYGNGGSAADREEFYAHRLQALAPRLQDRISFEILYRDGEPERPPLTPEEIAEIDALFDEDERLARGRTPRWAVPFVALAKMASMDRRGPPESDNAGFRRLAARQSRNSLALFSVVSLVELASVAANWAGVAVFQWSTWLVGVVSVGGVALSLGAYFYDNHGMVDEVADQIRPEADPNEGKSLSSG
jgi:hypothetical protein